MSTIPKPVISNPRPIEPGTSIGHVHLKVSDLNRAIAFYGGVLGFDVMQRYGDEAAFLSGGGYHHHIGLNTWESKGGSPPEFGTTGLYHFAIRYPTRRALANALRRQFLAPTRRMARSNPVLTDEVRAWSRNPNT